MKVCSVSKTSSTGTPSVFALTRSRSTKICGTFGRKVVKRFCSSGERSPSSMIRCATAASSSSEPPARSWSWNSKPPVRERPRIGAGFSANDARARDRGELGPHGAKIVVERLPLLGALVPRRERHEDRAEVRREGAGEHVEAAEQVRADDARRVEQDPLDLARHLVGALERGAVRELEAGDEVALVLVGHEAGGTARKRSSSRRAARRARRARARGAARARARRGRSARTTRRSRGRRRGRTRALRSRSGRIRSAQSAGESVSAFSSEISTAQVTARPNWRSSRPVVPGRNATGTKTAPSTSVAATIALVTSPIERRTASRREKPSPSSRATFSTTTIASSTTSPIASTSAKSVIVLIESRAR